MMSEKEFITFVIADLRAHSETLSIIGMFVVIFICLCYLVKMMSATGNAPIPKAPRKLDEISEDIKEIKNLLKKS